MRNALLLLLCCIAPPVRAAAPSPLQFKRVVIDEKPPRNPWIKIVGDLNGDGKPDIIIGGSKGPLVWYRNPDWHKFAIATGGYDTVAGAAVDVDANGDLDIALGGVVWFENPGFKGDSSNRPWSAHDVEKRRGHDLLAADLDSDGKVDFVMCDQSSFGSKSGHNIFLYKQVTPTRWTMRALRCGEGEGVRVADVNGDHRPDTVIGGSWFENSGDLLNRPWTEHMFTTQWNYPHTKVAVGDLNGDHRLARHCCGRYRRRRSPRPAGCESRRPFPTGGTLAESGDPVTYPSYACKFEFPERPNKYVPAGKMPPMTVCWYEGSAVKHFVVPADLTEKDVKHFNEIFVGTKGYMGTSGRGESVRLIPESKMKTFKKPPQVLKRSPGHSQDWIRACQGGDPACSNFSIAGPYAEWMLLGAISWRFPNEKLMGDGKNLRFTNNEKANEFIKPRFRKGWERKDISV